MSLATGFKRPRVAPPPDLPAYNRGGFIDFALTSQRAREIDNAEALERLQTVYKVRFYDHDGQEVRALAGHTGSIGGFLVPAASGLDLLSIPAEIATVADAVTKVWMSTRVATWPVVRSNGSHAGGDSPIVGGIRTEYVSDLQARTPTQPALDQVTLEARNLVCYSEASSDFHEDLVRSGQDDAFFGMFQQALASRMDFDATLGSGVGEPLGMLNAANPALVNVTREASGDIVYRDALNMIARFLPAGWPSARWLAAPGSLPALGLMRDDAGRTVLTGDASKNGLRLCGIELRVSERASALGTAGDLALVAPQFYLWGTMLPGPQTHISQHHLYGSDKTAYKVAARVDGQPFVKTTITLRSGDVVSPYVRLQ